jgi:hypothetical protein
MDTMFDKSKNYLIVGPLKTYKTELGLNILNMLSDDDTNTETIDLFANEKENNIKSIIFMDNYSTKDNRNKNILNKLRKGGTIVAAPYALGVSNNYKTYFDVIFVPRVDDQYTLKLIYNHYFKFKIKWDLFEKLNSNLEYKEFMFITSKNNCIGKYGLNDSTILKYWNRLTYRLKKIDLFGT